MLTAALLAHVIAGCAPEVGRRTMSSIVAVESGGDPLAIHDNTTNGDYRPASPSAATALASQLIGLGHSVDIGLAQINSANLPHLGLSVRAVFDPCTNIHAGATILSESYARARTNYGPGQFALRRAIGAYNTGSLTHGDHYIASVVAAAGADFGFRGVAVAEFPAPKRVAQLTLTRQVPAARSAKPAPKPDTSPNDAPVVVTVTAVPVAVVSNGTPNL